MKRIFCLLVSLSSLGAMAQNSISPISDVRVCKGTDLTKTISWNTDITAGSGDNYVWSISGLPPCLTPVGGYAYTGNTSSSTDSHTQTFLVSNTGLCGDYSCTLTVTRGTEPSVTRSFMIRVYSNIFNEVVQQIPSTNGTPGCLKKFTIINPDCPTAQSPFPPGCGTKYNYLIYRGTSVGSYPASTAISSLNYFPLIAGNCNPTLSNNIWYRLRNDGNSLLNINATMPDNLPFSTLNYYVICYIDNTPAGCCAPSGYAPSATTYPSACVPFQITQPSLDIPVYVCSKNPYPPGTYNQCCEKKFELNTNSNGTGTSIIDPNLIYQWIIQSKSGTIPPLNPTCLLAVTATYPSTVVCTSGALPQNIWYAWGTSSSGQMAPKLPPLSGTSHYYVSCYIQRLCNGGPLPPYSKFAVQQKFQVLPPLAPVAPVITVNAPCSFITYPGGIKTITKCISSPGVITVSVSPVLGNTTYRWYKTTSTSPFLLGTGPSYTFPMTSNVPGDLIYVTATTSWGYITPGCSVSSEKMRVIIKNCPACPGVVSGSWTRGPGTYSFIVGAFGTPFDDYKPDLIACPGTTFKIKMEVWGAGGYGKPGDNGSGCDGGSGGRGGGGGGYAVLSVPVTVPTCGVKIYWITVGSGGTWSINNGGITQVRNINSSGTSILKATGGVGGATGGAGGIGSINSWAGVQGFPSSPAGHCHGTIGGLGGAGGGPGSIGNDGGAGGHGGYANCVDLLYPCTEHGTGYPYLMPGIDGGNGRVVFSW